jgi:HD-GYP domain-containing protein (c-di-GMP phosphodiesterase class II)
MLVVTTIYDDPVLAPGVAGNDHLSLPADADQTLRNDGQQVVKALERAFGQSFSVVDTTTGQVVHPASDDLPVDPYKRVAALYEIAQRGRPEVVDEVSPILLIAVPLPANPTEPQLVAVATFITETVTREEQIRSAAQEFGVAPELAFQWAQARTPWHPHAIQEVCAAVSENTTLQQAQAQLKRQLADLSSHLLTTFEEITLLHRLTEHLSISKSVTDLCGLSVQWLAEVVPAKSVAIWFDGNSDLNEQEAIDRGMEVQPVLILHGECPLQENEFARFIERLGPRVATEPLVLNRAATNSPTWFYPDIRELISVPIREGNRVFGWLLVLNHTGAGDVTNSEVEFGTVEACLMASVATILGIHCGNIALYREQAEFFASVVRALTSAIDAKDPYTCGHSDRVARLSVCLARELGCNKEDLNTIYLSGLLHDIGKIGIDDQVLRKPGPLTPEELEHIKTHPDLGCRILDGVKQLDQVLPVVRHHHEAWNGGGYPDGLKGEECPYLARIVAVADSIDAMSSDRPYRKGLPDIKLDSILREGAGRQWDACVIDAAFRVREEIRRIGQSDRKPLELDVGLWQSETAPIEEDSPFEQPAVV